MSIQNMEQGRQAWRPTREQVSKFLRSQQRCVLSTLAADGQPQGALVAFSETDKGDIIIGTSNKSRKAHNIQGDSRVAITVTDVEMRYTVQAEAHARILTDEEFEPYADQHYEQLPSSRPFRDQPGEVNILITPFHLRFSDCNVYPWVLTEFDH